MGHCAATGHQDDAFPAGTQAQSLLRDVISHELGLSQVEGDRVLDWIGLAYLFNGCGDTASLVCDTNQVARNGVAVCIKTHEQVSCPVVLDVLHKLLGFPLAWTGLCHGLVRYIDLEMLISWRCTFSR